MPNISELLTPSLILDRQTMRSNLSNMAERIGAMGGKLRPHVKTHKSIDVLKDVEEFSTIQGITVSTLKEALYFADHGVKDIMYAVSLTPDKVSLVRKLRDNDVRLTAVTDDVGLVGLISDAAVESQVHVELLIELDVDGHRSGVAPEDDELLEVARSIETSPNLHLRGVMTHAGGSYGSASVEELQGWAANERDKTVKAANRLRALGFNCETVSIGSTPTASVVDDLTGITEVRPGVYTFFDLFQAGLGIADLSDIAISVLATVIGHQREKGWVLIDAGWMAMSRDRGTAQQLVDQGYGVVCDLEGQPIGDMVLSAANQEHGIVTARSQTIEIDFNAFPIGRKLRILPNHACATAAQFEAYQVYENGQITETWPRISGW